MSLTKISGVAAAIATVATDVATLVADGASPTQGHVNTLNMHCTALQTALTGLQGDASSILQALRGVEYASGGDARTTLETVRQILND